jgi:hypothetical protein
MLGLGGIFDLTVGINAMNAIKRLAIEISLSARLWFW